MVIATRVACKGAFVCVAVGLLLTAGVVSAQSDTPATAPSAPGGIRSRLLQALTGTPPADSDPNSPAAPSSAPAPPSAPPSRQALRPGAAGTFDVNFQGTDLRLALRLLSTQGRRNIVTTKEVAGTVTADLYGVTFRQALDAVLRSSGFVFQEKDNFIYVMTPKQYAAALKAQKTLAVRTFRLVYVTAADARALVAPAMSAEGIIAVTPSAAVGIATSGTDTGGNSLAIHDMLVIRDYEENLRRIDSILREVDVKPEQVLIEATILRATLTETNQLGIDFHVLAGVDFERLNTTSAGLESITKGTLASGDFPTDLPMGGLATNFASGVDAGGLSIGFISNTTAFFIRALEGVTDVTVLANPKLLVVNKQRGEVMVGNRDGYLTTTVTETVATQTVEFLETGTRLVVRPFICRNGLIRMEIHPEDSSGSVSQVGSSVLPSESTTEITSNVLVRDGHTIVIGGLFRERTTNGRSQIPVLGNIPYLGTLFRRTNDATVREEVIILITPRIIRQEIDEALSEQLKDDTERFRIGQRKGLRWWGRDRLAQIHMREAKKHLQAGRPANALWDIDMAMSLSPRMEEAIRLKERLTEKAFWADESQVSTIKYIIQRMIMNELGKPVERVIPPGKPRDAYKLDRDIRRTFDMIERPEDPLPGAVPGGVTDPRDDSSGPNQNAEPKQVESESSAPKAQED